MITVNDILNLNIYNLRYKDWFTIILKSDRCFTLGKFKIAQWQDGTIDLDNYTYICKCLNEYCKIEEIDKIDFKIIKMYINNKSLQDEIYLMEDLEYNRRLKR